VSGPSTMKAHSLQSACAGVIIVAHHEDTSSLHLALTFEGLNTDEVRGPYAPEQESFSAIMKCLANHANAWRIAITREKPTIIVEADFVPVKGFGSLPIPAPTEKFGECLPYLYACGPQIWDLTAAAARGHAGGMVALVVWPKVARLMLEFFEAQLAANPQGHYTPFDTKIGYWLMDKGIQSYLPQRQYGEHGGISNPEHARAGLGRPHHADSLANQLMFLPAYAEGSRVSLWRTRIMARAWGWLRLLTGRLISWRDFARSNRGQMIGFLLGRLLGR
jgi:hypothetical protein